MRYEGFSIERHKEVTEELKPIMRYIHKLALEIGNSYGSSKHVTKKAFKVEGWLRDLLAELDTKNGAGLYLPWRED